MALQVTKAAARRFLLQKQGLRGRNVGTTGWELELRGEAGVEVALQRLEAVQLDPIAVIERNHHLVLRNRVAGYRPEQLDGLFAARRVFEYLANARCVLPMADLPAFWPIMLAARNLPARLPLTEVLTEVVAHLREHGEAPSRAVGNDGPRLMGIGYNPADKSSKASNRAIDLLWLGGELLVSRRQGNEKWYDLASRVVPPALLPQLGVGSLNELDYQVGSLVEASSSALSAGEEVPIRMADRLSKLGEADVARPWAAPTVAAGTPPWQSFLLAKYMRAYGLADLGDFRFGWQNYTAAERRALAAAQVEAGGWIEVAVEGVRRRYYALAADRPILEAADEWETTGPIRFLAPLDNLLWRRPRLQDLFEFDYVWEVYTPAAKRKYGYYALPILDGDRLIGRLDPKLDRQRGVLVVNLLQLEEWVEVDEPLLQRLRAALIDFAQWHGAAEIEVRATDPALPGLL